MHLYEFAYCGRIDERIAQLASLAAPEDWSFPGETGNPVLKNYVFHTFSRLAEESGLDQGGTRSDQTKLAVSGDTACFNTGLFTEHYEPIYGFFKKNTTPGRQPWYLQGFSEESDHSLRSFQRLPERATYFTDVAQLVFDYRLEIRIDKSHILNDTENRARLPVELQTPVVLEGAVNIAKKRVAANYRLAVPQYFSGQIQLLVPLGRDGHTADVALVISKENQFYVGHTCLTLNMAYNNARLIAKPDSDWLKP